MVIANVCHQPLNLVFVDSGGGELALEPVSHRRAASADTEVGRTSSPSYPAVKKEGDVEIATQQCVETRWKLLLANLLSSCILRIPHFPGKSTADYKTRMQWYLILLIVLAALFVAAVLR